LTGVLAAHAGAGFTAVDVAIETDRGLLVAALHAAGHRVFPVNPKAVDRYRDRHAVSGAKSDPGDALVLAHLLRTDRDRHRPLPDDSERGQAVGVLARAHQDLIWARQQDTNRLRSLLREFFPAALTAFADLTTKTALTVLAAAPTPAAAAKLTRANLVDLLHTAGRGTRPADAARLADVFAVEQLHQLPAVETAMGEAVRAIVRTLTAPTTRSNNSSTRWPRLLTSTRTPRSSTACPGSVSSSAPGYSASSETTRPASPMLPAAAPTPAPPPSPAPPAAAAPSWPGTSATNAWPTPATGGPSAP